jgi:protein-tyrosine phosphatase
LARIAAGFIFSGRYDLQLRILRIGRSPDVLQPDIYWLREIEGVRLAIMPRPRNGEWLADEISGFRRAGIDTVVSLLEPQEVRELCLGDEPSLCEAAGIQFVSFPVPDRGVPSSPAAFARLVGTLVRQLRSGNVVAIHCRAGIGRSGLLAGCVLGSLGVDLDSALGMLSRARGVSVPDTNEQAVWVRDFVP